MKVAKKIAAVGEVDRGGFEGAHRKWGNLAHRAKKYLKVRNDKCSTQNKNWTIFYSHGT